MKLARCFPPQQSLFASTLLALFVLAGGSSALAQDQVVLKRGGVQQVKIISTTATSVTVQVGAGTTAIPLSNIATVVMAPPEDFTKGWAAYEAKNYPLAAALLGSVVEKYRGLPADWAQQAAGGLGDVYLAMNDLPKAEKSYTAFQKAYPGQGGVAATVGMARIAVARKDFAAAKAKLGPIAEQALKQPAPSPEMAAIYGQTFLALGEVEEQAGNFPEALQNYLRTVTLFYKDTVAVASAQEHADALRQAHAGLVVP